MLLEPFADIIKFFTKKAPAQNSENKFLFIIASIIAICPIITAFCLVPFFDITANFQANRTAYVYQAGFTANILLLTGLIFIPAIGTFLADFSDKNKLLFIHGIQALTQTSSTLIPIITSILAVSYLAGSLNTNKIILAQSSHSGVFGWYFIPLIIGAIVFFVSALILLNGHNFNHLKSENATHPCFSIGYLGAKHLPFKACGYLQLFFVSIIFVSLFFGGYLNPFGTYVLPENFRHFEQIFWLLTKTFVAIFCFILINTTLPKAKCDKLLGVLYKVLLPLSLINSNVAILILYFTGN